MEKTEKTQYRIKRLTYYLDNSYKVTNFSIYYSKYRKDDYYYSINGFLDGSYFGINLYSSGGKDYVSISDNTECIDEIEEILNVFLFKITKGVEITERGILDQITILPHRANSILDSADGLRKFLST